MFAYRAGYKHVATGVHAQALDFPAAISWGRDLPEARRALASALVEVAESLLADCLPLPVPDPSADDPAMDIVEAIYLRLDASSQAEPAPVGAVA